METQKIIENKDKVVEALSDWIIKELKNTSSIQTESILVDVLNAYAKLTSD